MNKARRCICFGFCTEVFIRENFLSLLPRLLLEKQRSRQPNQPALIRTRQNFKNDLVVKTDFGNRASQSSGLVWTGPYWRLFLKTKSDEIRHCNYMTRKNSRILCDNWKAWYDNYSAKEGACFNIHDVSQKKEWLAVWNYQQRLCYLL